MPRKAIFAMLVSVPAISVGSQPERIDFYTVPGNPQCPLEVSVVCQAPVAQLDRAPDYESGGWGFKSLRARQPFYLLTDSSSKPL